MQSYSYDRGNVFELKERRTMSKVLHDNSALGHLLERNLLEVFGEPDAERRKVAISEIYAEDCTFYEPDEPATHGRNALSKKVEKLQAGSPGFVFRAIAPAQVDHDLARLHWQLGPPGGAPVVSGMDIAIFDRGRIKTLYTLLDSPPGK